MPIRPQPRLLAAASDRGDPDCHGWCFGLPPGITPAQWPLDPANGYPLGHGFTLLLPEDYRCHGSEIVAVSFFASALDHTDGKPIVRAPEIRAAMSGSREAPPQDSDLLPFWRAERTAHPRTSRMQDILGIAYAAILLTRAEFEGSLCEPPRLTGNRHLNAVPPPCWMTIGTAAHHRERFGDMRVVQDLFGREPPKDLAYDLALHWTPRACDPNAGRAPTDPYEHAPTDYEQPFYFEIDDTGQEVAKDHRWVEGHAANHIGGTMRPVQSVPAFSPFYVEFEEEMGGYNFGSGIAQLDVRDMKFDWACG